MHADRRLLVYSRMETTCLTTCLYRVWYTVTRLLTRVSMVYEHLRNQSIHQVQRDSVFTHGPSPCNPDTLQLTRYYSSILVEPAKNGKETDDKRNQSCQHSERLVPTPTLYMLVALGRGCKALLESATFRGNCITPLII
jgi:hypothetical protein